MFEIINIFFFRQGKMGCTITIFLLLQALFGKLLFGEVMSLAWCFGATLVVAGLALMHTDDSQQEDKEKVS